MSAHTLLRRQSSLVGHHGSGGGGVLPNMKRLPSLKPTPMVPLPSIVYWDDDDEDGEPQMNRLASSMHAFFGVDFRTWLPMTDFTYDLLYHDTMVPVFAAFVVVVGAPIVLFPVFLCLKIDGTISWTWTEALIPLWVINVVMYIYLPSLVYMYQVHPSSSSPSAPRSLRIAIPDDDIPPQTPLETLAESSASFHAMEAPPPISTIVRQDDNTTDQDEHAPSMPPPPAPTVTAAERALFRHVRSLLMGMCLVLTQLLVTLRLDGAIVHWRYVFVLAPLAIFYLLDSDKSYFVAWNKDCVVHVVQVLLVALKLDKSVAWPWAIVFFPTWLSLGLVLFVVMHAAAHTKRSPRTPLVVVVTINILQIVSALVYFLPYGLVAWRLDAAAASFSSFYIVLPWFLVVGAWGVIVLLDACAADRRRSIHSVVLNQVEYTSWYLVLPWDVSNILPLLLMASMPCLGLCAPHAFDDDGDVGGAPPLPPRTEAEVQARADDVALLTLTHTTTTTSRLRPPTQQQHP
ncbi:Aste57867_10597 [Aphanomyces stellatus]|uniref:Aste57867_10597 protein n=1 Tax=Aphanomyces stellatus TaxID=120398 RepID=A0A485KQS6_9STRA|nr:hypothetical protein As57867_010557 [Aphanomyces stellatus]VFT87469.1 Aste57867_10597 [Aphanomyces stellatus]